MKSLMIVTAITTSVTTGIVQAEHARDDWPEPVKSYQTGQVLFDRLEWTRTNEGDQRMVWDMLAWYGGDENRVYFKSEGSNQRDDGEPSELESAELLGSHLIRPFWEIQGGIGTRGSLASGADREDYLVFSLFGMAPYRFEVDNSVTINEDGHVAATMEAEYDIRLSQVSYLQPRVEVTAALNDAEEYERYTGFNDVRLGLRYRHELSREFAPYVGVYWSRSLGEKADYIQDRSGEVSEYGLVAGFRMWF